VAKSYRSLSQEESKIRLSKGKEVATLGGGCFWCLEAIFDEVKGVEDVESGYSGGTVPNPRYEQVCTGTTGHAEVVHITFDPSVISFREILEIFFAVHDPTTLNRQGPDVGAQYRSVIFYHSDEQRKIAEQLIEELNRAKIWDSPIVTQLEPFKGLHRAESYHQEYFKRNPSQPYCQVVLAPKLAKFRQSFREKLRRG